MVASRSKLSKSKSHTLIHWRIGRSIDCPKQATLLIQSLESGSTVQAAATSRKLRTFLTVWAFRCMMSNMRTELQFNQRNFKLIYVASGEETTWNHGDVADRPKTNLQMLRPDDQHSLRSAEIHYQRAWPRCQVPETRMHGERVERSLAEARFSNK